MEPMTLGSPTQSPKNLSMNITANSPFLPAYLMGEQQNTPAQRHGSLSPTKNRTGLFRSPVTSDVADRTLNQSLIHQGILQTESPNPTLSKQKVIEKTGPPVQGLFDTLEARYKYNPTDTYNLNNSKNITTFDTFQTHTLNSPEDKLTSTPKRPFGRQSLHHDNFNTSNNWTPNRQSNVQMDDSNWVTILGFPSSSTNVIMAHFAQCGTIVEKKFPSQGNWVHIKYSNQYEANKALAFNGKILAGSIMVGVLPYKPNEQQHNKENLLNSDNVRANLNTSNIGTLSPRPVRSLAQPYLSPQHNNVNESVTSPVPQKSTGIVTKAMEYVFGW